LYAFLCLNVSDKFRGMARVIKHERLAFGSWRWVPGERLGVGFLDGNRNYSTSPSIVAQQLDRLYVLQTKEKSVLDASGFCRWLCEGRTLESDSTSLKDIQSIELLGYDAGRRAVVAVTIKEPNAKSFARNPTPGTKRQSFMFDDPSHAAKLVRDVQTQKRIQTDSPMLENTAKTDDL
jgi:hypothetical protein